MINYYGSQEQIAKEVYGISRPTLISKIAKGEIPEPQRVPQTSHDIKYYIIDEQAIIDKYILSLTTYKDICKRCLEIDEGGYPDHYFNIY